MWADAESNPSAVKVSNIMTSFGLTQLVNGSTHTAGHTLDHVYANLFDADLTVSIQPYDISDYFPIMIELPYLKNLMVPKTFTY